MILAITCSPNNEVLSIPSANYEAALDWRIRFDIFCVFEAAFEKLNVITQNSPLPKSEREMVKVWPGLERWPKVYHFFHYLNISKPLPRIVDYIAWPIIHLQLLLSLSQIHLLVKVGTIRSVFAGCDEGIGVV